MKIVKYNKLKEGQVKADAIVGGGGGGSSTTIEGGGSVSLDREIWGQKDTGDDVDGSMTVNGDVKIQVISYQWDDDDDEGTGDDVEYESGGGNLTVELTTTTKDLVVDNDAYVKKHLYINYSHDSHTTNKKCVAEVLKTNEDNIKTNADEISGLKTRMSAAETSIDSLDTNMQNAETAIRNNAEEIAALKNRTTAAETAIANYLPIGAIIMFSGTMGEIPAGWAICNGENGTPNLIGKFVKAWTASGVTGGANSVTLSASNLPEMKLHVDNEKITQNKSWQDRLNKEVHTSDWVDSRVIDKGGSENYCVSDGKDKGDSGLLGVKYTTIFSDVADYMYVGEKNNTQTAVSIEPEYYSLIYIMRVS